jgi:hypothetical protein
MHEKGYRSLQIRQSTLATLESTRRSALGKCIGDLPLIKANSGWLIDTGVASTCFQRLFGA